MTNHAAIRKFERLFSPDTRTAKRPTEEETKKAIAEIIYNSDKETITTTRINEAEEIHSS